MPAVVLVIVLVVILIASRSLWDRFRREEPMERYLAIPGLEGLCNDYLGYIRDMTSGQYETETIRYLDSQRQVTHDQILERLGMTRMNTFNAQQFARRYLERHSQPEQWEGDVDEEA
jgi:hypothetical protein